MNSFKYLPRGYAKTALALLFFEGYENITTPDIYNTRRTGKGHNSKEIKSVLMAIAVNNYQKIFKNTHHGTNRPAISSALRGRLDEQ